MRLEISPTTTPGLILAKRTTGIGGGTSTHHKDIKLEGEETSRRLNDGVSLGATITSSLSGEMVPPFRHVLNSGRGPHRDE